MPQIITQLERDHERARFVATFNEKILEEFVYESIFSKIRGNKTSADMQELIVDGLLTDRYDAYIGNLQGLNLYNVLELKKDDKIKNTPILIRIAGIAFGTKKENDFSNFSNMTVKELEQLLRERGMYYPMLSSVLRAMTFIRHNIDPNKSFDAIMSDAIDNVKKEEQRMNADVAVIRNYCLALGRDKNPVSVERFERNYLRMIAQDKETVNLLPAINLNYKDQDIISDLLLHAYHIKRSLTEVSEGRVAQKEGELDLLSKTRLYAMQMIMTLSFRTGVLPGDMVREKKPKLKPSQVIRADESDIIADISNNRGFHPHEIKFMNNAVITALNKYGKNKLDSNIEQFFKNETKNYLIKFEKVKNMSSTDESVLKRIINRISKGFNALLFLLHIKKKPELVRNRGVSVTFRETREKSGLKESPKMEKRRETFLENSNKNRGSSVFYDIPEEESSEDSSRLLVPPDALYDYYGSTDNRENNNPYVKQLNDEVKRFDDNVLIYDYSNRKISPKEQGGAELGEETELKRERYSTSSNEEMFVVNEKKTIKGVPNNQMLHQDQVAVPKDVMDLYQDDSDRDSVDEKPPSRTSDYSSNPDTKSNDSDAKSNDSDVESDDFDTKSNDSGVEYNSLKDQSYEEEQSSESDSFYEDPLPTRKPLDLSKKEVDPVSFSDQYPYDPFARYDIRDDSLIASADEEDATFNTNEYSSGMLSLDTKTINTEKKDQESDKKTGFFQRLFGRKNEDLYFDDAHRNSVDVLSADREPRKNVGWAAISGKSGQVPEDVLVSSTNNDHQEHMLDEEPRKNVGWAAISGKSGQVPEDVLPSLANKDRQEYVSENNEATQHKEDMQTNRKDVVMPLYKERGVYLDEAHPSPTNTEKRGLLKRLSDTFSFKGKEEEKRGLLSDYDNGASEKESMLNVSLNSDVEQKMKEKEYKKNIEIQQEQQKLQEEEEEKRKRLSAKTLQTELSKRSYFLKQTMQGKKRSYSDSQIPVEGDRLGYFAKKISTKREADASDEYLKNQKK